MMGIELYPKSEGWGSVFAEKNSTGPDAGRFTSSQPRRQAQLLRPLAISLWHWGIEGEGDIDASL